MLEAERMVMQEAERMVMQEDAERMFCSDLVKI
jgi:hypothetical protein